MGVTSWRCGHSAGGDSDRPTAPGADWDSPVRGLRLETDSRSGPVGNRDSDAEGKLVVQDG
jgi:hypothetical protein